MAGFSPEPTVRQYWVPVVGGEELTGMLLAVVPAIVPAIVPPEPPPLVDVLPPPQPDRVMTSAVVSARSTVDDLLITLFIVVNLKILGHQGTGFNIRGGRSKEIPSSSLTHEPCFLPRNQYV
ncbi:MAG: hypothetical protein WB783_04640 [Arenicellales bacterium]